MNDSPLPARIGARYDVIERLGSGGSAVVYRVRDRSSRELALKQLHLNGGAQHGARRTSFEREFHLLAQLKHPSAVQVHDFGVDLNGPYYTMELLDRGDLSTGAPWRAAEACELMMQVCSLLSLLHARGFVHRDLSPRNVRLGSQGAAKLIDFGAMVPMGPSGHAVGTPGFVAPEVLHRLALDARTDLFSLGATLYYALTGEKPFAARSLEAANELWRKPPKPPSACITGIPAALDALVLSLLHVDPERRPSSAFEVMQRLAALSGKPLANSSELSRAYLSTPVLVGREREQRRFRQSLGRALLGEGSAMLIEGASGSGRSRLLDSCALQALTSGAIVLHGTGRAARRAPFACAHGLAEQLLEALPDEAPSTGQGADALFMPAADGGEPRLRPLPEWAAAAALVRPAWLHWLCRCARARTLVIAVDDLERIDGNSLGLLAGLASAAAELRLLLLNTAQMPLDASAHQALKVLEQSSTLITLDPLSAEETQALFHSVFAAAPRSALVSARIYALSAGNPRAAMALAEYLVDQELIRYADGGWVLPPVLPLSALPSSMEEAERMQLASLPPLARRLAEAQALAFDGPWTKSDYRALELAPGEELVKALVALLRHAVIVEHDDTYTFTQPALRAGLIQQLTAAERERLNGVLAAWCVRTGRHGFVEAHHLLQSSAVEVGLTRLTQVLEQIPNLADLPAQLGVEPRVVASTLERAREISLQQARPPLEACEFARRLIALSMLPAEAALYQQYAPQVLQQLALDSGLDHYRAADPNLAASERLRLAFDHAVQRYTNTPERERVYRVDQAIKHLATYVNVSVNVAESGQDMGLLASMPALIEPFAQLSPILTMAWTGAVNFVRTMYLGQFDQAHLEALRRYGELDKLSANEVPYLDVLRLGQATLIALLEVRLGYTSAERWIELIERDPLRQAAASRFRQWLSSYDGDLRAAARWRRQAEARVAEAATPQAYDEPAIDELAVHMHLGDLTGVKHLCDRVAELAARWPGWRAMHLLVQAVFHRMRGDLAAALPAFERALATADPERAPLPAPYAVWVFAAEGCMGVRAELGHLEVAYTLGLAALARCEALQITGMPRLEREFALVEAELGRYAQAAARLDAMIERHGGRRQWLIALDYEARARVAIHARDRHAAAHFARLALQGPAADSGGAQARRGRLLEAAQHAGLEFELELPRSAIETAILEGPQRPELPAALRGELEAALTLALHPAGRAARALELLCRALQTQGGQLYFVQGEELVRRAARGAESLELDRFASGYWRHRAQQVTMTTVLTERPQAFGLVAGTWTSPKGASYCLLPLSPSGEAECVGLAALVMRGRDVPPEYWALSAAICARLQILGDLPQVQAT